MIFTNQALALFPPALGQAIAHTQRDRQELVEEICCRIGQVPVLLTQAHAYPAECRAILAGDLDYLLERATGASVYAAGEQIRQGYLQTAGGWRVGLCGCAYGQAAGQIDGIRQLSSVSVRIPHAVPGCADALLPQLLKDAGYFTIHVGKAHWASAGTPGASPYNMGFVVNVSGNVAGMPRSYQSEENYGNTPEKWNMLAVQNMTEYYGTGVHLTEALTREALKTLEYPIRHGEPFFLYMAHYATHTPIQPDKRFIQKYLDAGMDKGQARYASMVEGVDKSLGDLLDYLKEMGVEKNTVVVFMTDNGGNSENKQKGGVLHTQNKPLREGKGSCYEGGVRVPLMFRWPGRVAPNTRVNTPVIVEDLFPTLLEVAGVRNPRVVQAVDGESLVKLVTKGSEIAAKARRRRPTGW